MIVEHSQHTPCTRATCSAWWAELDRSDRAAGNRMAYEDPDAPELDVLHVSAAQMRQRPQAGTPRRMSWAGVCAWLGDAHEPEPLTGDDNRDKAQRGAWSPCLYRDGRRCGDALAHASAVVIDVDGAGEVSRVARLVSRYRAVVHATYKSTPTAPRCRVVLALAEPIDAATYRAAARVVLEDLRVAGLEPDTGATTDPARLHYLPMVRPGATYQIAVIDGEPLDVNAMLAAIPPPPTRRFAAPRPEHRDRYVAGALRRAADAIATAREGDRHHTLASEAYGLARLGLADSEIAATLLPAFITAAGHARGREAERTIADAIRARRRAS